MPYINRHQLTNYYYNNDKEQFLKPEKVLYVEECPLWNVLDRSGKFCDVARGALLSSSTRGGTRGRGGRRCVAREAASRRSSARTATLDGCLTVVSCQKALVYIIWSKSKEKFLNKTQK